MAKFRMVHTEFWNDAQVVEEMTPEDKYFYLYLLTNPNTTQVGIYQITKKQMAFDTGYSMESINSLLDRFIHHHKRVVYNSQTRELALINWGKYNLNRGGKPVLDCVQSELKEVKDKTLIPIVGARVDKPEIKRIYDTYDESYTIRGQEKEEEEEKEKQQEEEGEEERPHSPSDAFQFFVHNIGPISPFVQEDMLHWIQDTNEPLVLEALKRAVSQNKRSWNYAKSILKNWQSKNILTVEAAEAEQREFERYQSSKQPKQEMLPKWFEEEKRKKAQQSKGEEQSKLQPKNVTDEEIAELQAWAKSFGKNEGAD